MVILYELTQLNARTKGAKINKGFDTFHIKQMILITFLHIDLPNITIQITIYITEHTNVKADTTLGIFLSN